MQGLRGDRAGKAFAGDMHQPERLVSMASVKLLKHLHLVAESIENVYGDKSSEKAQFVTGVQGKVSRYNLAYKLMLGVIS